MRFRHALVRCTFLTGLCGACQAQPTAPRIEHAPQPAPSARAANEPHRRAPFARLERAAFNRRAVELDLPLFWRSDADRDGELDAGELAVTWHRKTAPRSHFVTANEAFTPLFHETYERMVARDDFSALSTSERARREAVRRELAQGRPTLIESDFSRSDAVEQTLLAHLLEVARQIERIYARQKGVLGLENRIPPDDPASHALFFRNQGPFCVAPATEADPACHALPERAARTFGLYPTALQADARFCEKLERLPNAKELMDHFGVVVEGKAAGSFAGLKYSRAFPEETRSIAESLLSAAKALGSAEPALQRYLSAAAAGFTNDDWEPANEAWAAMSPENSRYYLRVAPDEVYFEPCAWKAGFALTFARINRDSLDWQARLEPFKQGFEDELAALAGKPYRARTVKFKLPDFIDIVLNAGDSRAPLGGTIGQSLPNWGAVAQRGGRTVTMTNIGIDADSREQQVEAMSSMFCAATMEKASTEPRTKLLSVVLHEAAHNLGPSHDYAAFGKVSEVAFGGGLAAMLEELKAQTAALYLPFRLVERGLVSVADAELGFVQDVAWAFGHTARGMYDSAGHPRHYSQLASIQLGSLVRAGALVWKPDANAANGTDRGCFEIDFSRRRAAVAALMKDVLSIKARGDRARAQQLMAEWVDGDNPWKQTRAVITERQLRAPRASYVYAIHGMPEGPAR